MNKGGSGLSLWPALAKLPLTLQAMTTTHNSNGQQDSIRVLLVDDHPVIQRQLKRLVEEDPSLHVVGQASDGSEAVQMVSQCHPEVVLMDYSMPNMSGVEATRQILTENPDVRVIGFSMEATPEVKQQMYRAGVKEFLNKEDIGSLIRETIHQVRTMVPFTIACTWIREASQFSIDVSVRSAG